MFGIDTSEYLLLGAIALVVIGPKDLPRLMRVAGQWIAKVRRASSHVRAGVDEMVRQAELTAIKAAPDIRLPTSVAGMATILLTPNTRDREPGGVNSSVVPLRPGILAASFASPGALVQPTAEIAIDLHNEKHLQLSFLDDVELVARSRAVSDEQGPIRLDV